MLSFDRKQFTEDSSPVSAEPIVWFFALWTGLAGLFFLLGIIFILATIGLMIQGQMNGQPARIPGWFLAIMVPFMLVYQGLSWWFFRSGLTLLRHNARRNDAFDADGQPKCRLTEGE